MNKLLSLTAALVALAPPVFCDTGSLPPSDVRPEEVYTPQQIADHVLGHLEDALQRTDELCAQEQPDATALQQADARVQQVLNHIEANPDLRDSVRELLEQQPERARRIAEQLARLAQHQHR